LLGEFDRRVDDAAREFAGLGGGHDDPPVWVYGSS